MARDGDIEQRGEQSVHRIGEERERLHVNCCKIQMGGNAEEQESERASEARRDTMIGFLH